jgi:hypothetical protein
MTLTRLYIDFGIITINIMTYPFQLVLARDTVQNQHRSDVRNCLTRSDIDSHRNQCIIMTSVFSGKSFPRDMCSPFFVLRVCNVSATWVDHQSRASSNVLLASGGVEESCSGSSSGLDLLGLVSCVCCSQCRNDLCFRSPVNENRSDPHAITCQTPGFVSPPSVL